MRLPNAATSLQSHGRDYPSTVWTTRNGTLGWYISFAFLMLAVFITVDYFTGQGAVGATTRFVWNGTVVLINGFFKLFGSLLGLLARGVGWRRVSRLSKLIAGVGLGYAGTVMLSEDRVRQALGWRDKLRTVVTIARGQWLSLPLFWKFIVIAILICSQLYLHFLLIIFPIAFLVPVVRALWVRIVDLMFASWYWRIFGERHRTIVASLHTLPFTRQAIGAVRLARLRYLYAWRLWKYHPRYRDPITKLRTVNLIEPLNLWWNGRLDGYVGRPLLAGTPIDGRREH
jgi:hypothetical protein